MGKYRYLKGNLELFGLGHAYHDAWWRRNARKHSPFTEWNYQHEVIFVHIPKTAGLSIYEMFGMHVPREGHCPVAGYRAADATSFKKAYKFTVIRNPWDRLVSAFHYLKYGTTSPNDKRWVEDEVWSERYLSGINSFPEFKRALHVPKFRRLVLTWRHFLPQHYFITTAAASGLLVDQLVRYEDLENGLEHVATKIGLPLSMVQRNMSEHAGYQQYYSEADIRFIGRIYTRDIKLLGYTFAPSGVVPTAAQGGRKTG